MFLSLLNILFMFSFIVFLIGVLGFLFTRLNVFLWLLSIEIMIFGANLNFLWISIFYDDLLGQIYVLLLLIAVGAESAFALILLISIYRAYPTTDLSSVVLLKY